MPRTYLLALFLLFCLPANATKILKWTDENGQVHFGDRPPTGASIERVTVRPNVYSTPSVRTVKRTASASKDVVLFSAEWCVFCHKARDYFRSAGIRFKEYDIEKSREGARKYKRLGATGIPVILVGSRQLNGFSETAFKSVYEKQ